MGKLRHEEKMGRIQCDPHHPQAPFRFLRCLCVPRLRGFSLGPRHSVFMKLYPLQDYHRLKCPSPALTMTFNKPTVQYPYQDPYGNIMVTQNIPFHREGPPLLFPNQTHFPPQP